MSSLILASGSPQRKRLLSSLGVPFEVSPSLYDEKSFEESDPAVRAVVLAERKAVERAGAHPGMFVLGGDTLVVSQKGRLLEKPESEEEAREMIREQSGGPSLIHSAVHLVTPEGEHHEGLSTSTVHFRTLTDEQIDWWMGLGHWRGRSGSFQIEDEGEEIIEKLEGEHSGVVGLPLSIVRDFLEKVGLL